MRERVKSEEVKPSLPLIISRIAAAKNADGVASAATGSAGVIVAKVAEQENINSQTVTSAVVEEFADTAIDVMVSLGIIEEPNKTVTPVVDIKPGDVNPGGSEIVEQGSDAYTTPAYEDPVDQILENIPEGIENNSSELPIQDDFGLGLVLSKIPTIQKYSDGSYRTPDGKFASVNGEAAPGTAKANDFVDFLRLNGIDVVGTEMVVSGPLGDRRYDAVVRDKDGKLHGIEIKSGSASKNSYQDFSDLHVNLIPADGKGRLSGEKVESATTVYVP
jgi:hypothetical protein